MKVGVTAARARTVPVAALLATIPMAGWSEESPPSLSLGIRADAPPFAFRRETPSEDVAFLGTHGGFAVELCAHVAEAAAKAGRAPPLSDVTVTDVTADTRFPDGQTSDAPQRHDILCDPTSMTRTRLDHCAFTIPFYVTGIVYAAMEEGVDIADLADLAVGYVGGTTAEERLTREWDLRFGFPPDLTSFELYDEGLDALAAGKVEALFGDQALLQGARLDRPDKDSFTFSNLMISIEMYGMCVAPDRPDLLAIANDTLAGLYASGDVWLIVNRHFRGESLNQLQTTLFSLFSLPEN